MNRYFEDPAYLWLLVLVPALIAIYFVVRLRQKKRLRKFGDPELVRQLMPDVSRWRAMAKYGLLLGSLTLLIVSGFRKNGVRSLGVFAIIALAMMLVGAVGQKLVPPAYFGIAERFSVFAAVGFTAVLGLYLFSGFIRVPREYRRKRKKK